MAPNLRTNIDMTLKEEDMRSEVLKCLAICFLFNLFLCGCAGTGKQEAVTVTEAIFGKDADFSSIRSIVRDSKLNLYVLDNRKCSIMAFDENGVFKMPIGNKGQGPGEYSVPVSLEINKVDELIVYDIGNHRVSMLSTNGRILKEISTSKLPRLMTIRYVSEGVFIGLLSSYGESNIDELIVLDENMEKTATIARMESKPDFNVIEIYPSTIRYCAISETEVIWGDWFSDKLFISDISGKLKDTIILPFKKRLISDTDKELSIKRRFGKEIPDRKVVFPKYYPYYYYFLFVDDDFYFLTFERGPSSGHYYYILNIKNKNLRKIFLDPDPIVIYRGTYYSSLENEEGGLAVKKIGLSIKSK